eukprot:UN04832
MAWKCFNCNESNSPLKLRCKACVKHTHPDLDYFLNTDVIYTVMQYLDHLSMISFYNTNLSNKLDHKSASILIANTINTLYSNDSIVPNYYYNDTATFRLNIDLHFDAISMLRLKHTFFASYKADCHPSADFPSKSYRDDLDTMQIEWESHLPNDGMWNEELKWVDDHVLDYDTERHTVKLNFRRHDNMKFVIAEDFPTVNLMGILKYFVSEKKCFALFMLNSFYQHFAHIPV